jgi:hypothetical protein
MLFYDIFELNSCNRNTVALMLQLCSRQSFPEFSDMGAQCVIITMIDFHLITIAQCSEFEAPEQTQELSKWIPESIYEIRSVLALKDATKITSWAHFLKTPPRMVGYITVGSLGTISTVFKH